MLPELSFYHFKAIVIAGIGLFTDPYDLFCIPPIMKLIGLIYYEDEQDAENKYETPAVVVSTMVALALLGMVIGLVVFGRLGLSLMLMVLSSIGCGFSICRTRKCVLVSLGFFRFMLGVGIGGDYPLSATIMSEFANRRTRGSFIAAVFSMQCELDGDDGGMFGIQCGVESGEEKDLGGGGFGVEAHSDVRCNSGGFDVLLAYDDAGNCQVCSDLPVFVPSREMV